MKKTRANPNPFQPTFEQVMRLAGVEADEFDEALVEIAVEFCENYVGRGERFAAARDCLYRTSEFWVWFKRLVANASMAWVDAERHRLPPLPPSHERWHQWRKLVRVYVHIYTPNDTVVRAYERQLLDAA
jgi:hypothetical protein